MASIFGYTDDDGDILRVDTRSSGDFLAFRIPADVEGEVDGRGVDIPRDHVLELHAALGEWLYPVHTPEGPNRSPWRGQLMNETELRRIIREEISRALKITALEADNREGYDTGELEVAGLRAVSNAADAAASALAETWHAWPCDIRHGGSCGNRCETNWEKN